MGLLYYALIFDSINGDGLDVPNKGARLGYGGQAFPTRAEAKAAANEMIDQQANPEDWKIQIVTP